MFKLDLISYYQKQRFVAVAFCAIQHKNHKKFLSSHFNSYVQWLQRDNNQKFKYDG
jgi:hypothetical protein